VIIGTLTFGGGVSTLGLDVITARIASGELEHEVISLTAEDHQKAKHVDLLLVSLYWWRNVYELVAFLAQAGIDPRKRKPVIVAGGMSALNPTVLAGYVHYTVLGDGEDVISEIVDRVSRGEPLGGMPGVVSDERRDAPACVLWAKKIPATHYVESRTNKITRIEISRGCRFKCPFCQMAHLKPYREQDFAIIRHLVMTAPTKNVALFAADRSAHTKYRDLEALMARAGKNNMGSDVRLDTLMKQETASKIRFGIEGFSEKTRKAFHKIPSNDMLVRGFGHIFNKMRTPKGKPITAAWTYMIGDLPGEGEEEIQEFWDVMRRVDELCPDKFTLFLSVSSFAPMPYTPMERCGLNPYTPFNQWFKDRPRMDRVTVATRGGVIGPSSRLAQMMTIRGDERLRPVVFWLATSAVGKKALADRSESSGRLVERAIKQVGFDPEYLYREIGANEPMPHANRPIADAPTGIDE